LHRFRSLQTHESYFLKKKYGIDLDQYNAMMIAQNSNRGICKVNRSQHKKEFHVDHDHVTGKVRGLLCVSCNLLVGLSKDSVETLNSAAEYLKKNRV